MTLVLSRPIEELFLSDKPLEYDVVIVGSGYGAAMTALALAMRDNEKLRRRRILVLERGNEYVPGDFPKTISDLPAHISTQGNGEARTGYADSLFDVRVGKNVSAIVGSGLGGTSLINAGVAIDPDARILDDWPAPPSPSASWLERLGPSLKFVRTLLGVQQHPNGYNLPKVRALGKLADSVNASLSNRGSKKSSHNLADIAVTFSDGPNNVGVEQKRCNDCGNCFTGCNTSAKNTLAMNAWPLAKSLGVDIVTGATVDRLCKQEQNGRPWTVVVHRTADVTKTSIDIRAGLVILAAGTFGSPEILLRSRTPLGKYAGLPVSDQALGRGFSLNGDGISFGFGQRGRVSSYAKVPSATGINPTPAEQPGPTIVSFLKVEHPADKKDPAFSGLIEDATVPQAISRMWGEVLATQALTRRYIDSPESAWHHDNPHVDPLSVSADQMDHHQVLLMMGTDNATGCFELDPCFDHLNIQWPASAPRPNHSAGTSAADQFDEILDSAYKRSGFDGGLYLANPFWKPFPHEFEHVFEGASKLGGLNLCNHPLGGCPMAADASRGVVNTRGQVFSSSAGSAVHDGLYVLDGSIVPGALGINPYMTIAALAHSLALQIDGGPEADTFTLPPVKTSLVLPRKSGRVVDWPVPALAFTFRERLFGCSTPAQTRAISTLLQLSTPAVKGNDGVKDEGPINRIVIDIDIAISDMYRYLEDPSQLLAATFTVFENTKPESTIDTIADRDLRELAVKQAGHVQLFARDAKPPSLWRRGLLALWRFYILRRDEFGGMATGSESSGPIETLKGLWRVARQHGHWRYFRYSVEATINKKKVRISGEKRLAYDGSRDRTDRDGSNLWTSLGNIELTFQDVEGPKHHAVGWFRVDLVRMARHVDPLQCINSAETPQIAAAVAGVGALALRALIQTHLWSFGAPSYKLFPTRKEIEVHYRLYEAPTTISYDGKPVADVSVEVEPGEPGESFWRLMRAVPRKPLPGGAPPVLLIHGISHSSRMFYTESVHRPLAGFILEAGYEVWMLDHGLSTALRPPPGYRPLLEDISAHVTAAVKHVYHHAPRPEDRGVLVFSHCIGAASLSMAILKGTLVEGGKQLIEALVMHAVPPWIHASEANLVRAYMGVFFRQRFFPDVIDPIPASTKDGTDGPTGIETILDRVGSSLPWTASEFDGHKGSHPYGKLARAICNRMTLYYGYEWAHSNLGPTTHDAFPSLMGAANVDAYRELYFLVDRARITDKEGANSFLTDTLVFKNWQFPTLFLHGRDNYAFNVESSRLSRFQIDSINLFAHINYKMASQSIRLKIVDHYGHLDTLIGKDAWQDVFGHITDFFRDHASAAPYIKYEEPRTATSPIDSLKTGPIISHPKRLPDGRRQIRIWAETDEFQTSPSIAMKYISTASASGELDPIHWIRDAQGGFGTLMDYFPNILGNSTFYLGDFLCDARTQDVVPNVKNSRWNWAMVDTSAHPDGIWVPAHFRMNWSRLPWYRRFIRAEEEARLAFVVGSCWYPGSWFDLCTADRVFAVIRDHVERDSGIDHLLLVGDQIYADASYAIFDIAENRERYQESHRHAFLSKNARWVLAHIPTYFAIDDHEFRDNYPTRRAGDEDAKFAELGAVAAQEAWNYQMHHESRPVPPHPSGPAPGPASGSTCGLAPGPRPALNNHLWYSFDSAGFSFFVFDTRSERGSSNTGTLRVIADEQREGFIAWVRSLTDKARPLFLVTGSPLVPIPDDERTHPARAMSSDTLRSYPEFVKMVASTLADADVRGSVVWLSGDPHFSSVTEFSVRDPVSGQELLSSIGIISSGINVPLPFANDTPDEYMWNHPSITELGVGSAAIQIEVSQSHVLSTRRSHAVRVELQKELNSRWQLNVAAIESDPGLNPTSFTFTLK
ncbi:MAG: GMC family oxidoreductase N-terminal domain-containing protein [Steroidobacteraceae bacterium]